MHNDTNVVKLALKSLWTCAKTGCMMMVNKADYLPFCTRYFLTCKAADVAGDPTVAAITIIGTAVIKIPLAVSSNDH
jgi:hypothetical protein